MKQTRYSVRIEKRHCEGRKYMSIFDCPLCAAIKEQLPDFKLRSVGGNWVTHENYDRYFFNAYLSGVESLYKTWNSLAVRGLLEDKIPFFDLIFDLNGTDNYATAAIPSVEQPKSKEIIRYVSVPTSINEQSKELILN